MKMKFRSYSFPGTTFIGFKEDFLARSRVEILLMLRLKIVALTPAVEDDKKIQSQITSFL